MNIFLLFFLVTSSLMAAPRVVILTSVQETKIERKVSDYARKHLPHFEIEIKHKATQNELYEAILSVPDALIWLSHGSQSVTAGGIGAAPQILDHTKDNIAPIFQVVSPQTAFLSVVSCFAEQSLTFQNVDKNKFNGSYFPRKKIVAMNGFKKAIKALKITDMRSRNNLPDTSQRQTLRVTRQGGSRYSLKVFNNKKFLGLINSNQELQIATAILGNIRIEFPNSVESPNESMWGINTVELDDRSLPLFSDKDGKPFGVQSRVYMNR
jgi:hypothetical protein